MWFLSVIFQVVFLIIYCTVAIEMSTEAGSHVAPGSLPVEACTTSVEVLLVTRGNLSCYCLLFVYIYVRILCVSVGLSVCLFVCLSMCV